MSRNVQSGHRSRRRAPVVLRLEELESRLAPANHILTVPGASQAQTSLTFSWSAREAVFNDEVGVYVVQDDAGSVGGLQPTSAGYAQAALSNAQVLFSSGQGAGASTSLTFVAGDRLAFFLVQNDTTLDARSQNPQDTASGGPQVFFSVDGINPDGFDHVRVNALSNGTQVLSWEDQGNGGDKDFNDVIMGVGSAAGAIGVVPGNTGAAPVATTFSYLSKGGTFNSEMGVYVTDNASGSVGGVNPGDPGYAKAALSSSTRQVLFSSSQGPGATATASLPSGGNYGLYLIANGSSTDFLNNNPTDAAGSNPMAYFSFASANPDGFNHVRFLPGNVIAWEDQFNGGDQNFADLVAGVQFATPANTTPPTTPTFDLDPGSDTNVAGDQKTSLATVTLDGTTDANTSVQLVQTGATTTSDSSGKFSFANIALNNGDNTFTTIATNAAGLTSQFNRTLTRVDTPPVVSTAIADQSLATNASQTLDLAGNFRDADTLDSIVRFDTAAGPVKVELFDQQAPRTVANFLNYVNSSRYANSIFHRSAQNADGTPFVLQGGGFTLQTNPSSLTPITTDPPVQNEADPTNRSNVTGTLAMAKLGGDPNSATDQFFFNLGNNAANLDNQNGGFTVFGKVVSTADQQVLNQLSAIPTQDQSNAAALPASEKGVFNQIPLQNYTGTNFPTDTTAANYALVNGVTVTRSTESLTYTATSSNPAVVAPTIANNRLTLQAAGQTGTTTITVTATDRSGMSVSTTFKVTVS